ncbi:hypothetical protein OX284_014240 [Flavobacterium sp. SUN046]|uniref:hypothetical protein n=1 Tax=Flavobacterium sp. SUN046 TaxID=3002440 RepID=UPI002DBCC581|nr:hypothetical protein [Flavobacterium sp. SUN046]MEC4050595.1 hypothetical protein [Flavobacterium sp. SUN046]
MQQIEKALKLVFDSIGNDYTLPQGEFINDDFGSSNIFRNPFFGQTPKPLQFGFGTRKELNQWIATTNERYPLVWLEYPLNEEHNNNSQSFYTYPKAMLIFAINTSAEALVQTRLQTTRFVLDQIIESFEKLMRSSHFKSYVYVDKKTNIKQKFYPNFSDNNQKDGATIDIWDAISYECDIHLIGNCVPN